MMDSTNMPIATQWFFDAAGEIGRATIPNIFMLVCTDTDTKGTGFLLDNGYIVTNLHVVNTTLDKVIGVSSSNEQFSFSNWYFDAERKLDLLLLKPNKEIAGGLSLDITQETKIGESVHTWGFPLGYNGPSPLFSAGYLSGFRENKCDNRTMKHLIINGAFNNGNSGGPLFKFGSNKVIGIVVTKHLPLTDFQKTALQTMANNQNTGCVYTFTDNITGESKNFMESQIVADILHHYQQLLQVMIGEAICATELDFLIKNMK